MADPFGQFNYIDPATGRPTASRTAPVGVPGYQSASIDPTTGRTPEGDAANAFRGFVGAQGGGFGGFVPEPIDPNKLGGTRTAKQPGGVGKWLDPSDVTADLMFTDAERADQARAAASINAAAAASARDAAPAPETNNDPFGRFEDPTGRNTVIKPTDTLASRSTSPGAAAMQAPADDPFAAFNPGITPFGTPGQNPVLKLDPNAPQAGTGFPSAIDALPPAGTPGHADPPTEGLEFPGPIDAPGGSNVPVPFRTAIPGFGPGAAPSATGGAAAPVAGSTGFGSGFRPIGKPGQTARRAPGLFSRFRPIRKPAQPGIAGQPPQATPFTGPMAY